MLLIYSWKLKLDIIVNKVTRESMFSENIIYIQRSFIFYVI